MCKERKEILTAEAFLIAASEYLFCRTFLTVWWGLVRLVTGTTARVC
jgi:hypothetical protein